MHLPLLHISDRALKEEERGAEAFHLGQVLEREIIPWLANRDAAIERSYHRRKFFDVASLSLAALGSEVSYFALLSGLFSAYDRKTALLMAAVIVPSVTLNQLTKSKFKFSRPPKEAMHPYAFVAPGDFTFPSGHAQNAIAIGLFVAQRAKRKWIKIAGITFAVCIPLSRVYLGVHYPRDVLAAGVLGIGSVALVNVMEQPFRAWWITSHPVMRGFTVAIIGNILGLLTGTPLAAFPLAVGGGLALGNDMADEFKLKEEKLKGSRAVIHGAVGISLFLGVGYAVRPLLKKETTLAASLAGSVVGISLTFGVPLVKNLGKRLKLAIKNSRKKHKKVVKGKINLDW